MTDDYQQELEALAKESRVEKEEWMWAVIEGVAEALDDASDNMASAVVSVADLAITQKVARLSRNNGPRLTPNPLFVAAGLPSGGTEVTEKYFTYRESTKTKSKVFGRVGALASLVTQADGAAFLQGANASGSSLAHWNKCASIAKEYADNAELMDLLNTVKLLKKMKATTMAAKMICAAIPFEGAGGFVAAALQSAVKLGITFTMTKTALFTAAHLHYLANREGGKGGATAIIRELFTKRGFTRVLGKHDPDGLIAESSGWMAIKDKLMLF